MSDLALRLAHAIKQPTTVDVDAADDAEFQSSADWFRHPGGAVHTNYISYDTIANHADREYLTWRTVADDRVTHEHSLAASLRDWVRDTSVEEIARVLDTVPDGLGAHPETGRSFSFLGWQRLSMAHAVSHLFDVTSRVEVTPENLQSLAAYRDGEARRHIPITAQMSMLAGSCPDRIICDLGTACGKTSWSLGVAMGLLLGQKFEDLKRDHRRKSMGLCVRGPPDAPIARLVIVAAAGMTFQHFVDTARRMVPRAEKMDSTAVVYVWDKVGKNYNTTLASQMAANAVVIWVVPVEKIMHVLRENPCVTVPVVITDEYTVNTPRERSATDQSYVMKNIITQATPQDLQDATRGNRSWLREHFGGFLYAPRRIPSMIHRREWNASKLAADQLVKFDLMTLTPFRAPVRDELRPLIPQGLAVTFLRSRRITLAAHLMDSTSDLVPADFTNVLLSQMSAVDDASRERLRTSLANAVTTPVSLVEILDGLTLRYGTDRSTIDRLKGRLTEYSVECPICKMEDAPGLNLYGCCGYCVCDNCYGACSRNCPFCRTAVRDHLPRAEVQTEEERQADEARDAVNRRVREDEDYPPAPPSPIVLNPVELRRNNVLANVTHALHYLRDHGHRRLLIVLERYRYADDLSSTVDIDQLSAVTGVQITRVDRMLGGKAMQFAQAKRVFDSSDPRAMAFLCYGVNDTFMVGTDLAAADGIVVVGSIPPHILTQAIARTMRPNELRDNSRPMQQINVYVGHRV